MPQRTTPDTRDPVRQFLRSAMEAKSEAARHRLRVMELESRATRMTASATGTPGGGGAGAEQLWATLADERDRELAATAEEFRRYHEVERFILRLGDPTHRAILRLRYLNGLPWFRVRREMEKQGLYYTERHVTRLHGEALKEARRIWWEVMPNEVHP